MVASVKATATSDGDDTNPNHVAIGAKADFVEITEFFDLDQIGPNEFIETFSLNVINDSDVLGNFQDALIEVNLRCMIP